MLIGNPEKICILGVGPSGLAATVAALRAGYRVDLLAKRLQPSHLYGCQYLHAPIPGHTSLGPVKVSYRLKGTPEEYRRKVYGDSWVGAVSAEDLESHHLAWDLRQTYRSMWDSAITDPRVNLQRVDVTPQYLEKNQTQFNTYKAVISTIPAIWLCSADHDFELQYVWAVGSTRPGEVCEENSIVCDGTSDVNWYRHSRVFGYSTTEWADQPPHIFPAAKVDKPLRTNCDCFPDIIRMGRYGRWQKGILVHQVYEQAAYLMDLLEGSSLNPHICRFCGRWGEGSRNEAAYRCPVGHVWTP